MVVAQHDDPRRLGHDKVERPDKEILGDMERDTSVEVRARELRKAVARNILQHRNDLAFRAYAPREAGFRERNPQRAHREENHSRSPLFGGMFDFRTRLVTFVYPV